MQSLLFIHKIIVVLLITQCIFFSSYSQWYNPEKVNKKAKAIYESGYDFAMDGNYKEAIQKINEALSLEPKYVEAYLSRAAIYADLKDYAASINDFDKAFALDTVFCSMYQLPYSISLAGMGEFEKALSAINNFLKIEKLNPQSIRSAKYRKSTYEFAINYKQKHPDSDYNFSPVNLGSGINSNHLEYYPSLTIDGKKMIFTRRIKNDEDFYESELINNVWTEAKPAPGKINTNLNEGAQNISQDGEWLIFTGCNYPEGVGSCDLYISYKLKNGGWTQAENFGPIVNTDQWESAPSLSPDKRDLYFSSNRFGGYGGKDIWVSHRMSNGKWGRPENLGPVINTSADETCPFMHADNQTLYLISNGHQGYGSSDIFLSRKLNDSSWSTPLNLGYPINTIDDEGSLIVSSDGKMAYYASDRLNESAGLDIYSFQLREEIRAAKTLWIKGKVFDKKTSAGLPSTVELTEINTRRIISRLQTDEEGNYLITLPEGTDYAFIVNRKGYLFYSDNFSIPANSKDSFFTVNIPLQPIEAGAAIILKNIFFDNNKFDLRHESIAELDRLVLLMNENPKMTIQINGHTDNAGNKEANKTLSLNRAKSVMGYLLSKGIKKERLQAKGFGDTLPIASNDTEQGKTLNRRTEINIVSN